MDFEEKTMFQRVKAVLLTYVLVGGIYTAFIAGIGPMISLFIINLINLIFLGYAWNVVRFEGFIYLGISIGLLISLGIFRKIIKSHEDYDYPTDMRAYLNLKAIAIKEILLLAILGFAMNPTGAFWEIANISEVSNINLVSLPLIIMAVIFLEPMTLELMFRSMLYRKIKDQFSIIVAIIGQGVLYGLLQYNIMHVLYAVVFMLVVLWTGSLYAGIIVHAAGNLNVLITHILGRDILYRFMPSNQSEAVYWVIFVLVLGLLYRGRRYNHLDENNPYFKS